MEEQIVSFCGFDVKVIVSPELEGNALLVSPGAVWLEKEKNVLTGEEIEVLRIDPKKLTILKGIANARENTE